MNILQRIKGGDTMRVLSKVEANIGTMVFEKSFNAKTNEKILIVCDPGKRDEASIFFETARRYCSNVDCLVFDGMTENAQEPLEEVREAMKKAEIVILVTTFSLSHTQARKAASEAGARIASLPYVTHEMMERILVADPTTIRGDSKRLADLLSAGDRITISSSQGTDLSLSIHGRTGIADTGILHQPGDFGNLPAGEAFIAPVEGSANGLIIVDGAIADIELDAPVKLLISEGCVREISGGKAAGELTLRMNEVGTQARVLCELGIGTNPKARLSSNVLEAEKVYGTCHVAFGDNSTFGGINHAAFHTDCVLAYPTVMVDGRLVLSDREIKT